MYNYMYTYTYSWDLIGYKTHRINMDLSKMLGGTVPQNSSVAARTVTVGWPKPLSCLTRW